MSLRFIQSLSDIDKFTYLKGLLTVSASDCITGLSLNVQNYTEAVNILQESYANPQVIISAHMESLVKLPAVRDVNNVRSLRKSYDRVESSIQNLKSVKKGHFSKNCDSKYKCNKCSSRHHISIYGNLKQKTAVNVSTNKNNSLLQTANAHVSAVESNSSGLVRILFDTGSDRGYVTNDTRTRLNLPIIRKEKLVIQAFGHYESKLKNVDIVQMKIKGKSSSHSIFVEAIGAPEI